MLDSPLAFFKAARFVLDWFLLLFSAIAVTAALEQPTEILCILRDLIQTMFNFIFGIGGSFVVASSTIYCMFIFHPVWPWGSLSSWSGFLFGTICFLCMSCSLSMRIFRIRSCSALVATPSICIL